MGRLRVYMFHPVSCVFFSPWYPLIINRCLGFAASRRWKWPGQLLTLPTGLNTWKRQIGCWDRLESAIWIHLGMEWTNHVYLRSLVTGYTFGDWRKRATHSWLDVEGIRVLSLFQEFRLFKLIVSYNCHVLPLWSNSDKTSCRYRRMRTTASSNVMWHCSQFFSWWCHCMPLTPGTKAEVAAVYQEPGVMRGCHVASTPKCRLATVSPQNTLSENWSLVKS